MPPLNRCTQSFSGQFLPDFLAGPLSRALQNEYEKKIDDRPTYGNTLYLAWEELSLVKEKIEQKNIASRLSTEDQRDLRTINELQDFIDALEYPAATPSGLVKRQNILRAGKSIMISAALLLDESEGEKCALLRNALKAMATGYNEVLTALEGRKRK